MDAEFLKYLSTLGVGGMIAGFMFMVYRKDMKLYSEQWQGQATALLQVVKENTAAVTANTTTIQALHRREDRMEEALGQLGYIAPHRTISDKQR